MKVLHLINQLTVGGAEKLILDAMPIYNQLEIQADVMVHKGTKDDLFLKQLKAKNCCSIIELPFNSVYDPRVIVKLKPYLNKYDIIHAHLFPGFYFLALSKFIFKGKCKLVYTEHNTTNRRMKKWWLKGLDKFIYKKYDKIICITKEIKNILNNYIPFKIKDFVVIENGIDLTAVKNGIQKAIIPVENKKIITQIAAFRPQKDQQTLIKALKKLPSHIHLLLAGTGETLPMCKNLVNQLNLEDRVHFLGNRADVPDIMASSDILVLSSHYEGLSLSSIEAMASGKVFIASNVPGLKELVTGAGVLFEQGNDSELSQKISDLLNNESLYKSVAENCMNRAKSYDINIMAKKYIHLYHETLH